ncbi:hypothetical protein ALNOE001_19670 [Candidatus Methanobinarius endosymbioticus]|uniref:Uncharacterized protein n=1 Tax=Candidatus Methanobinarius endosymbioticus TaxID=2006182 RepID=A0A366M8U4_9EURY|nr:hypothetical protein ALNOE001_19670 [Candidatus Methanobinarius endosymbioticus]
MRLSLFCLMMSNVSAEVINIDFTNSSGINGVLE